MGIRTRIRIRCGCGAASSGRVDLGSRSGGQVQVSIAISVSIRQPPASILRRILPECIFLYSNECAFSIIFRYIDAAGAPRGCSTKVKVAPLGRLWPACLPAPPRSEQNRLIEPIPASLTGTARTKTKEFSAGLVPAPRTEAGRERRPSRKKRERKIPADLASKTLAKRSANGDLLLLSAAKIKGGAVDADWKPTMANNSPPSAPKPMPDGAI